MTNQSDHPDHELYGRLESLSRAFRPAGPVTTQDLFSGRTHQLLDIGDVCFEPGRHGVIYGERGVGKTSLAAVASAIHSSTCMCLRINCDLSDDFASLWHKVAGQLEVVAKSPKTGDDLRASIEAGLEVINGSDLVPPDRIRQALALVSEAKPVVVFFDEFDVVRDDAVPALFSNTIKSLSDQLVDATLVVVGVADSVEGLIEQHESIERALTQIKMPRMDRDEIRAIVTRGLDLLGMQAEPSVLERIVKLPLGLPHYAHLLAQEACRSAILRESHEVQSNDLEEALKKAIEKADQTIKRTYQDAVASSRETLYEEVLLACALAVTDPLGFFAPVDVRQPLSEIMHKPYDIPQYAGHLTQFCDDRGPVLERRGGERRWRYRFINPMMQPYVLMRGIEKGRIDAEIV